MKTKNIRVRNINSIRKYLTLFSGIYRLTDAELDVLAEMIRYQLRGRLHQTASDPFSSEAKKVIAGRLEMANPYSINTYLQRFRKKAVVIPSGDNWQINPQLMPMGEKYIAIELEWKLNLD